MTESEKILKVLAETLGEDPNDIQNIQADWLCFMQDGVVVNLHIRRWRASVQLELNDLGLIRGDAEEQKAIDELMKLGQKFLLPAEILKKLNSIDSGARQLVKKYSYETHWGSFMPAASYLIWKDANKKFVDQYYAVRDEINNCWIDIRNEIISGYAIAARRAFRRLTKLNPDIHDQVWKEDIFVDEFVNRIISSIPNKDEVYDSFGFEIDLSFIPLPSLLAEDLKQAELSKLEVEKEQQQAALEYRMKMDVFNNARDQKNELVNSFMSNIMGQLRSTTYNAVLDVLSSIKKNGELHPRSVSQLKNLVDNIRNLNFYADVEVDQMITQVKSILNSTSPNKRELGNIQEKLRDIATITRSTLINLGEQPRSGRILEIPDIPTEDNVRKSRNRLFNQNQPPLPHMEIRKQRIVSKAKIEAVI